MNGGFIRLITITPADGPFGETETESPHEIYANEKSIGTQEFYAAKGVEVKVDLKLEVYASEYNGEVKLKYNDNTYRIVRTYKPGIEKIELVCARV